MILFVMARPQPSPKLLAGFNGTYSFFAFIISHWFFTLLRRFKDRHPWREDHFLTRANTNFLKQSQVSRPASHQCYWLQNSKKTVHPHIKNNTIYFSHRNKHYILITELSLLRYKWAIFNYQHG